MVESNNWSSDMNSYYPVLPCPYADPRQAPLHLQYAVFSGPLKLMEHVATEVGWFFTKGFPRMARMLVGREKFKVNNRILREGHRRHHTRNPRRRHFGRRTHKTKAYYGRKWCWAARSSSSLSLYHATKNDTAVTIHQRFFRDERHTTTKNKNIDTFFATDIHFISKISVLFASSQSVKTFAKSSFTYFEFDSVMSEMVICCMENV